jgi:hypothetical protein
MPAIFSRTVVTNDLLRPNCGRAPALPPHQARKNPVYGQTLASRIYAVRKAIGDSGQQQKLIRTIPRKGLRFVGEVRRPRQTTNSESFARSRP